jgi:porin
MSERWLGRVSSGLAFLAVAGLAMALPVAAGADCDVTESGIPDNVIMPIDVGHVRKSLADMGIGIGGLYVSEGFGNPSGGIQQGATYDGVLELHLNGDMQKMGLWKGLCFHANGFQIHGRSITATDIGSLTTVSSFEGTPATRLFELWFEQSLLDKRISVRFGQLAADSEFLIDKGASSFLETSWPALLAQDLPSGGPTYPLATTAVRVAINPNDRFGLMIAVFNGDPAGPHCTGDPQLCNNNGLDFLFDSPPLLMAEGSYKYKQDELAGTIKLGGWNHFGNFSDQRFDSGGLPIAVTGLPGKVIHNVYGLYVIFDQAVWRMPGSDAKGVDLFGRIMGAPSDRNLVDFYADGGVNFSGMVPRRPDDYLAIGFDYSSISDRAHGFDLDSGVPVARNFEALLEICYTMQLKPGWTLQPDFQYIWQPGGNVPNRTGAGVVGNATVLGIRSTVNF